MLALLVLAASARMLTQISFWMPNLESKVWYAQHMSPWLLHLETAKSLLCFFLLLAFIFLAFRCVEPPAWSHPPM